MPIVLNKQSGVMGYKYRGLIEESDFIKKHPLLEPYLEALAMAYIKCRQFAGEEPKAISQTPLEQIREHIFGESPCLDCQDYVQNAIGLLNLFGEPVRCQERTIYRPRGREIIGRRQTEHNPDFLYH